jgi:tetratricopeptide (TPR) repeat protein
MRQLFAVLVVAFAALCVAAPVRAVDYTDSAAIDELFAQLRDASDAGEATEIAAEIWASWLDPAVPELAERMTGAGAAVGAGEVAAGMALYSEIVRDYPDYAEGWNQRATVEYLLGDDAAALADIARVLALEPRHFGARAGRVLIYLRQGRRAEALREMVAALRIHPYLKEKALFPELASNVTQV